MDIHLDQCQDGVCPWVMEQEEDGDIIRIAIMVVRIAHGTIHGAATMIPGMAVVIILPIHITIHGVILTDMHIRIHTADTMVAITEEVLITIP